MIKRGDRVRVRPGYESDEWRESRQEIGIVTHIDQCTYRARVEWIRIVTGAVSHSHHNISELETVR